MYSNAACGIISLTEIRPVIIQLKWKRSKIKVEKKCVLNITRGIEMKSIGWVSGRHPI